MAQQQISGLAALACYTVDTDDESENEAGAGEDNQYPGFGDLYIKQEVVDVSDDPAETWQIDTEGCRDPIDELKAGEFLQPQDIKTEVESESDSSSSSSSESDSDSSDSEDDKETQRKVMAEPEEEPKDSVAPKTTNELLTKDLPPVENLSARVSAGECNEVGIIKNIVEELVVVESVPGMPALDLETVLFVEEGGLALGRVFDVIGPVTRPLYVVRFNSAQHVAEKGVSPGQKVYFAPQSELTSYVFLEQLMRMKISDASWANDEEPPPQFLEFSDDEEEQKAKREIKQRKKAQAQAQAGITGSGEGTDTKRPRYGNQRYSPATNPFYRTSRAYHPGQPGGGVQWSDYNVPSQYQQPPPYSSSSSHYPGYYPPHSAPVQPAWPPQYNPNPYQQLAANINYHQQQHHHQIFPNLNLPPPPPPPPGTD